MNLKNITCYTIMFMSGLVSGNQMSLSWDQSAMHRSTGLQEEYVASSEHEIDFIDCDLSEEDELLDVSDLVPLWARVANKVVAPFFVLYNKFSHWWKDRVKKNSNAGELVG